MLLFQKDPYTLAIWLCIFIISIGLHEAAHAFTANALGDDTPEREGRLTLNPIVHLDLFGTIFLLIAGFGWGRSVHVEPRNLKHPLRDMALISFAGPGANFVLGALSMVALLLLHESMPFLNDALIISASLNFFLMFLNLVPIPPLDGSKVIRPFLPARLGLKFDEFAPYGQLVFLALVFLPGISTVFLGTLHGLTNRTIMLFGNGLLG